MKGFILAAKSKSSQMFDEKKNRIPTTYLITSPCHVIAIKQPKVDGYMNIQLGFGKATNKAKPQMGQLTKAGIETPLRFFREFRLKEATIIEENKKAGVQIGETKLFVGDEVKPSTFFKIGYIVAVSGTSKGKGFQGVVKRHHFKGQLRTHGYPKQRAPGSIGSTTTPGRVLKGLRMAGRMGNDRVTVFGLPVMNIDEKGMTVKGLIPGAIGGLVEVRMK